MSIDIDNGYSELKFHIGHEIECVGYAQQPAVYQAQFTPQAWVNDYAVEVDPQGDTEWDCSRWASTHTEYLDSLQNGSENLRDGALDIHDRLIGDPAAPEWIRQWQGPFSIYITLLEEGGFENVALECLDCGEILFDYDRPES